MIPAITEHNSVTQENRLASYATLHQATVSLQEMGERTITTQVKIDGDVTPSFDGWELFFKGERFILNIKDPQAIKDNTTRNSLVDLTFTSWVINELKRYYFFEPTSIDANTAIADKYKASVTLNVEDFVVLFNKVLNYYFGNKVVMSLYASGTGRYSPDPAFMEIDYTYILDVLAQFYETYDVRWWIEYNSTTGVYTIKAGYTPSEITDHDFEYGYKGGLLRFERQVQDVDIRNILLGRGGEKNLPYRYFKLTDPQNPEWAADPDAIPELANINFDRLRDINFRWYVRGWMQNPNRDTSWDATHTFPTYTISSSSPYYFAYYKGMTDTKFNPVEYVKDDSSISEYGERWGAIDDNDDVYPTIQGVSRSPIGRIDETVDVSQIVTDDIDEMSKNAAVEKSINPLLVSTGYSGSATTQYELKSEEFTIPSGSTGNITLVPVNGETVATSGLNYIDTTNTTMVVVNSQSGVESPIAGIAAGTYRLKINLVLHIGASSGKATGTFGYENIKLTTSEQDTESWKPTFDIWVKNIWNTTKGAGESDVQYSERVWGPILGDRAGNEAKVVFSSGFMSISEDYEFVIVSYPVHDTSKSITVDGVSVPSEWKITLRKSDAEYDTTGLYIPNATTGGAPAAGDKFFFTGIDMPNAYVQLSEEDLNTAKSAQLDDTTEINKTWLISLDKVRCNTLEDGEYGQTLADRLSAGGIVRIKDPRFTNGNVLRLFVQSITYRWNEVSNDSPYIVPDIEVALSDKVISVESALGRLQGEVALVKQQYARISDVERVVLSVAEPMFLKKTGESDTSASPTKFSSKITSKDFRQGGVGGSGWGLYRDNTTDMAEGDDEADGDSVIEVDRLIVRKEMDVNSLVVNQIDAVGGKEILSAAKIEVTKVIEDTNSYVCYFNQRQNSVANNFAVNDIALGQVFTPDNVQLRYYKMLVTAVGVDSITLAKANRVGSGAPAVGDVIVQFGNTSTSSRQYVIIRDVIGGGYERMLSGLNALNSDGVEYFFSGYQSTTGPRWFVGNSTAEYAEWINGQLTLKGSLIVKKSDNTYEAMSTYMSNVNTAMQLLQQQIDGQIQSWSSSQAPSAQTEPYPQYDEETQQIVGTANYPASSWTDATTRQKHFGDIYLDDSTGQAWRYTQLPNDGAYYWVKISDEEAALALQKATEALSKIAGLDYLKTATNEGTLVNGGLVLTSLIQLGQTVSGQYQVNAGINGIMNAGRTRTGGGIAAWYGGVMSDKDDLDTGITAYAKTVFRFDGSGYMASGNIHWDNSGYGGIPGITWQSDGQGGTDVIIGANVKLASVSGDTVTSLVSTVQNLPTNYVTIATAQTITGKKTFSHADGIVIGGATLKWIAASGSTPGYLSIDTGFASDSFVSAGGVSPGGGSSGIDPIAMWAYLTNTSTDTTYNDTLIHTNHYLPNVWKSLQNNDNASTGTTAKIHNYHLPACGTGLSYTLDANGMATNLNLNLSSSLVTTALGYTPVNPSSLGTMATQSASDYVAKSGDTMTGQISWGDTYGSSTNGWAFTEGLAIYSSVNRSDTGSFSSYSTALSIQGRYGFQIGVGSGENSLHFRSNASEASWQEVYHTGNLSPITTTNWTSYIGTSSAPVGYATNATYDSAGNQISTYYQLKVSALGSSTNPVYISASGTFSACTYSLSSTLNSGTANTIAYYSGANAVSSYTSTLGASNKPVWLNAGVPTAGDACLPLSAGSSYPLTGDLYLGSHAISGATTITSSGNNSIVSSLSDERRFEVTNSLGGFRFGVNSSGENFIWGTSSAPIRFGTNSTDRMRIAAGGNVGINQLDPQYQLDLVGELSVANTSAATSYVEVARYMAANIGTNGKPFIRIGRTESTNDSGWMCFNYAGAGSTSNYVGFGLHGNDARMVVCGSGNVGIGTSSPKKKFHVHDSQTIATLSSDSATIGTSVYALTIGHGASRTASNGRYMPGIAFNQLLGNYEPYFDTYFSSPQAWIGIKINNLTGSELGSLVFAVKSGTTYSDGPVECVTITPGGNLTAVGAITAGSSSDSRLKTNIVSMSDEQAMDIVMNTNPITFTWNALATSLYDKLVGDDIGLIAQDVQKYIPSAVSPIFEKYLRLDYTKLIAPMLCVEKNHEMRIRQLEAENKELREELSRMKNARMN